MQPMPNQPDRNTITVSFTLPRHLDDAVEARASREMTNKSDIIRRALRNYLTTFERARIDAEMGATNKTTKYPTSRSSHFEYNEPSTPYKTKKSK